MKGVIPSFHLYYEKDRVANIPINATEFVIGRKAGCHLRLMDGSVSREHCRVTIDPEGKITITDLNSTNGTLVNNKRVVKQELHPKDTITLGRCTLALRELDPKTFFSAFGGIFSKLVGKAPKPKRMLELGKYVIPQDNLVTQFDALSYNMIQRQSEADNLKKRPETYLKRVPKLQVVADTEATEQDITRFNVSQDILKDADLPTLDQKSAPLLVFAQPEIKGSFVKLPWKVIERVLIPVCLVAIVVFLAQYLLTFHIDTQMEKANAYWDQKLASLGEELRYVEEEQLTVHTLPTTTTSPSNRRDVPLTLDELWSKIDASPALRDFLLIKVLDQVLTSEDLEWTIDEALANLARINSVTKRLPSVRQLNVVLASAGSPFHMKQMTEGRVVFLSSEKKLSAADAYVAYKQSVTPRLQAVSSCAGERTKVSAGKVVLAFTIGPNGKPVSAFVNPARSTKEQTLWKCVRRKLLALKFPKPPTKNLSIIYSFNFAPPTKVEF